MRDIEESMENLQNEKKHLKKKKKKNVKKQSKYTELELKLKWYEAQYRLHQNKLFGSSSEKTSPDQLSIFNEAESESKPEAPEPTVEEITYNRKKKQGHREEMIKDLPGEIIEYH